jgi:MoaA/NifB/PqqE/SkfB family radical SAM enzyme
MIKKHKNIVPVISIEGFENDTDNRRGKGVYESVKNTIDKIRNKNIFFGVSITVTGKNYNTVTDEEFISKLINTGCKLFFFVEYVPIEEGTENLILSTDERIKLGKLMETLQGEFPGLFIAFPGDEEKFGGCLAAGRGFIHVSPSGRIEPCPFAPYSDININDMTLKDALNSKLLAEIRQNHDKLKETKGGCALWTNKEWVQSIINKE